MKGNYYQAYYLLLQRISFFSCLNKFIFNLIFFYLNIINNFLTALLRPGLNIKSGIKLWHVICKLFINWNIFQIIEYILKRIYIQHSDAHQKTQKRYSAWMKKHNWLALHWDMLIKIGSLVKRNWSQRFNGLSK